MATPSALRLRQLQQAAAAKEAAVRAAMQEAALVAGRQRSLPKPRAVPVEGAPLHMDPSAGEGPRGPAGVGMSDAPPMPADDVARFSEIAPEDVPDMYRLLQKLGNEGPNAMLPEEVLALVRAGADLDLAMAGPVPQSQVQAILRKVANQGIESLTPQEIAGLRRTIGTPEVTAPAAAPPAVSVPQDAPARPFSQQGKALVGDDGSPVVRLDDERFQYPDGTVVDVEGNVIGSAPGDLTDVSAVADDLENSATPIDTDATDPSNNLTPNVVRQDKVDSLAERIRQATAQANDEPIAGLARLQREVTSLSPAELEALRSHPMLAEGIESVAAKRNPEARQAAIANAEARLAALAQMAEVRASDRAAGQVRAAASARDTAAAPRQPAAGGQAAAADVAAARQRLDESLPEGDWGSLTAAFNALPAERKAAVLARMPSSRSLAGMLDNSTGDPTFTPNAQAQLTRGVNEVEDALIRLDAAMRSGDEAAIEAARDTVMDIQTRPMPEDERAALLDAAKQSFLQRQQAASELRNAIIGTDPMYVAEQERMLGAAVLPAPRPGIAPGARTPIVAAEDLDRAQLPSAYDVARAMERERQEMLEKRVPGGGLTSQQRLNIFQRTGRAVDDTKTNTLEDLPLAFKGDDTANPLESRSAGSRLSDTSDEAAIEKVRLLEQARQEALDDFNAASNAGEMARARQRLDAADAELARAFPGGRAARADGRLNAAGQQETLDNLIVSVVGGRPKAQPRLDRSSPDLSPRERAVLNADAADRLGEQDVIDLLPESPEDEVVGLGKRGKPGRMGSTQQQSRVQGAIRSLYGDSNPLGLATPGEGPELGPFPVFRTAEEAADDLLSRQTIFKPGTASWDYAREKLANAINDSYGPNSLNTSARSDTGRQLLAEEMASAPTQTSTKAGEIQDGTSQDLPAVAPEKPSRRSRKKAATAEDAKLDASDTDISDVQGDSAPATPGNRDEILAEIEQEGQQIYDEEYRNNIDSGMDANEAASEARAARNKHVADQTAIRIKPVTGDPTPAAPPSGAEEAKPTGRRRGGGRKKQPPQEAAADSSTPPQGATPPSDPIESVDGDASRPVRLAEEDQIDLPAAAEDKPKATPSSDEKPQQPPAADKKKGWGRLPWIAGTAAAVGGLGTLARINSGGGGSIDIPIPPGGGGRGGPGGGDFYPIPVNTDGAALMGDTLAQEAAIQRALDRIRGARAGGSQSYQTLQNYTIGR